MKTKTQILISPHEREVFFDQCNKTNILYKYIDNVTTFEASECEIYEIEGTLGQVFYLGYNIGLLVNKIV